MANSSHARVCDASTACVAGERIEKIVSMRGLGALTALIEATVAGVVYIQPLRPLVSSTTPRVPYSEDTDDDGIPETWAEMCASDAVVADTPIAITMAQYGFLDAIVGFRPAANGLVTFFDYALEPM